MVFYQYEEWQWNKKASLFFLYTVLLTHLSFYLVSRGKTDKHKAQNTVLALGGGEKKNQNHPVQSILLIILCQTDHPKSDS